MLYNMAQAISAPVLAAAVNSPLLLGQRLWNETRVALFQRSVDARSRDPQDRGREPTRVSFGDQMGRRGLHPRDLPRRHHALPHHAVDR